YSHPSPTLFPYTTLFRSLVVRYHDQVFPISAETTDGMDVNGVEVTQHDPDAFDGLLERQHYRLAYWRSAQEELNYRRFFTVDTRSEEHTSELQSRGHLVC